MKIQFLLKLLCAGAFCTWYSAAAQKKVVIMGSSTAAGFGSSTYQLSWAGRLEESYNINKMDGEDTVFYNLAVGGYNTYQELPAGYTQPAGRPSPDPLADVTKALGFHPDIVIINLPSNDVGAGFSLTETMCNFRLMYNTVTAAGAKCYITTTQPRNDYNIAQRQALLVMKDSILGEFGNFAINFWDDLVTGDGLNMLREDRRSPGGLVHPNDTGHNYLFKRVKDSNIFDATSVNSLINITKMYRENSGDNLIAEISLIGNQNVLMTIYNIAGILMQQKKWYLPQPSERMIVPIAALPIGIYFFKLSTGNSTAAIKAFIK
ncbi:SGNH/GDSL hydrolase family protein [Ferruginibacter paludis]|uniref:SGNH/GDSL hydrolase family protein n=1 Tax=Ferruginibacter paludis TaxID=1310417 RepID=UPI0025B55007|nr:SGNH/GDSL hydrolase family protein [Ferruginibacter paludis]MDN3654146.1 SGNH/GDSL hydrolase family protein [Ferruginibacter paludis]